MQKLKDLGLILAMDLDEMFSWLCITPDFAVSVWFPLLIGWSN
jgi:hypothetical protein